MTPAARYQTAIDILDAIADGMPAEQALTRWARASRYAGSKDRAAVRDIVFDALRQWTSAATRGGAATGRGRVLGLLRAQGIDPETIFTGDRYAPDCLLPHEASAGGAPGPCDDLPDWLLPDLRRALGADVEVYAETLRSRAPVFVRVALTHGPRDAARAALAQEGITSEPHPTVATALTVTKNARRLSQSAAYQSGWVELQDAASQALVAALPDIAPKRILDYCAGGGGKALAMADRWPEATVAAHDADATRMRDIPARSARAGARITCVSVPPSSQDLVLVDAPCSGSGTWRRAPEGLHRLTPDLLRAYSAQQRAILRSAAATVRPGGVLAYATCSVLDVENHEVISDFLAHSAESGLEAEHAWQPGPLGDGFYCAVIRRIDGA